MSAVRPQTVWERFSFVEMWAVRRQLRMASSVTALSGAARTKLPATPRKNLIRPSRIALMESTESRPWARGGSKPNSSRRASRKESGICSQMPIVRSPWTLLWPRTGQAPVPALPRLPRSSRKLTISRMVGTPCLCWVMPIAQQTTTRLLRRTSSRTSSISARLRPVAARTSSQEACRACAANSSKPLVLSRMKERSSTWPGRASSASSSSRLRAWKRARSPPGRMCRNRSAMRTPWPITPRAFCGFLNRISPASGSGLTATMRAPLSLACSSADNCRGWLLPGFCPTRKIRSAWWRSWRLTVPLPVPRVSCRAKPLDSWHMLLQSGRLLVP